jgi:hypothetical protein
MLSSFASYPAGNVFPSMDDMDFKMSGAGGHESMVSPFTLFEAAADRAQIEKDLKAHGATVFVPTVCRMGVGWAASFPR